MILGSRNRSQAQVGTSRNAGQIVLLLLGTAPQLAAERNPGRIEGHIRPIRQLHHCHTVVKVIGRDAFDAASRHRHGRIGLKSCHTQERDQRAGNVLAYSAAVGVVHLRVMERKALAFAHGDARITDIIGYPMGQYGDFFHFGLFSLYQFVHFLLSLGQCGKTAVCLVQVVKPERLIFPFRGRRHHQLRGFVKKIHHIGLFPERKHFVHGKRIYLSPVLITH